MSGSEWSGYVSTFDTHDFNIIYTKYEKKINAYVQLVGTFVVQSSI